MSAHDPWPLHDNTHDDEALPSRGDRRDDTDTDTDTAAAADSSDSNAMTDMSNSSTIEGWDWCTNLLHYTELPRSRNPSVQIERERERERDTHTHTHTEGSSRVVAAAAQSQVDAS